MEYTKLRILVTTAAIFRYQLAALVRHIYYIIAYERKQGRAHTIQIVRRTCGCQFGFNCNTSTS